MNRPFFARHSFLIFLVVAFLAPFIWRGTRLAIDGNNNNVKDWLPEEYPESADLAWFQRHFPSEQFVLVSWDGCILGKTERLNLLAEKLATNKRFATVRTGPELVAELTRPPLNLEKKEAIRRLEGAVVGPDLAGTGDVGRATCLIATLSDLGKQSNKQKRQALEDIERIASKECAIPKDSLRMGGPPVDNVAIDVEGERTLFRLAGLSGLVGLGLSYWCFRSFRLTAMVFSVGVLSAGMSLAMVYYFGLVERFSQGLSTARFGTVDAILMSMPAVVYVLGLSGAIHIVNYYRDACRHHGVDGAAEQAVGYGWIPCTLAALTTALGLASLYTSDIVPIKKFGVFSAVGVLATLSLLFTLLPACLYRFPPRENKKLPSRKEEEESEEKHIHPWLDSLAQWIISHNRIVCVGWVVILVLFAAGLSRIGTSVQLLKLFDSQADIIGDYRWLETHLGNLVPMEIVVDIDRSVCRLGDERAEGNGQHYKMNMLERLQLVERIQKAVENLKDVGRALSVATFGPEMRPRRKSVLEHVVPADASWVVNSRLEEQRDHLLSGEYFREEIDEEENGDELWRISARVGALNDVDYGEFVEEIQRRVEPILDTYRQRDEVLRTLHSRGKQLHLSRVCLIYEEVTKKPDAAEWRGPVKLLAALLRESGVRLIGLNLAALAQNATGETVLTKAQLKALAGQDCLVVAVDENLGLKNVLTHGPLIVNLFQKPKISDGETLLVEAKYTGVVPLVYKTQRQLLVSLRESIAWAFILIAVVMVCVLRGVLAGIISMIPNVFPIIIVFGALGWLGIKVDIGIMMTASVALGVAVDDTVHFLFWFQRGMRQGRDRKGATMLAYQRCSTAMFQTTLIAGLGLSVFAFSTFTPTQQFGLLMIALLTAALVGDLLMLPAMLAGPVGKFFCRRLTKDGPDLSKIKGENIRKERQPSRSHVRHDTPHRHLRT